jgi:hypothetical protein
MRQNKAFRILIWSIVVLVLGYTATELTNMPREFAPVLVLILNMVIKFINVEILGDL